MTHQYIKDLDTIIYKDGKKITLVKASAFRAYCTQYGIVMKTSKDFIQYMQIKRKYIPSNIYHTL